MHERKFMVTPTPKLSGGLAVAKRRQDRPMERLVGRMRHHAANLPPGAH